MADLTKVITRKYAVSIKMLESDWLGLLDLDPEEERISDDDTAAPEIESLIEGALFDCGSVDGDNVSVSVSLAD